MGNSSGKPENKDNLSPEAQKAQDQAKEAFNAATQNNDLKKAEDKGKDAAANLKNSPEAKAAESKAKELADKAKQAVNDVKQNPTMQKVEDKAKQVVNDVRHNPTVQKAEDKAKELADKAKQAVNDARHNATVQKVEDKAKEVAGKAQEVIDKARQEPIVQKVEDKAKEIAEKAKEVANKTKAEVESGKATHDGQKKLSETANDLTSYWREARNVSAAYYTVAKSELNHLNTHGPVALSNFKRDYVFPIDRNVRAAGHVGLCVLTFLGSMKTKRGFFGTLRNTAFVGLASGFVFHPESLNPFQRQQHHDE